MTAIASLVVSLVALALSLASYRRSGEASRREQLLRIQQRRHDGLLAALQSEFALQRVLISLRGVRLESASADIETVNRDTKDVIQDIKVLQRKLEGMDLTKHLGTDAHVALEAYVASIERIFHKTAEIESKAKRLTEDPGP